MDYDKLITGSFDYAKDGLIGHWVKWILLVILAILPVIPIMVGVIIGIVSIFTAPQLILPILIVMIILAIILAFPYLGYQVQVYRGENPAPDVKHLGALFSSGLRLFVVYLIYAIPLLILGAVVLGSAIWTIFLSASQAMTDPGNMMGLVGVILFGVLILIIVAFIIWLIEATAVVRFARTGSISQAFNFGEIFAHIGRIGTGSYIIALIIMALIVGIVVFILEIIPYIGPVILIIVTPFIFLFQARYLCLLYDQTEDEQQHAGAETPPTG